MEVIVSNRINNNRVNNNIVNNNNRVILCLQL